MFKKIYYGIFMSWGCFTAIPCPNKIWDESARAEMLKLLKYIGIVLGGIQMLLCLMFEFFNLPQPVFAALLAIYPLIITGCIHFDGFMDCCDAILSRRDMQKRQQILKDSHVGAFAVIGAAMCLLLNYSAASTSLLLFEGFEYAICMTFVMFIDRWMVAACIFRMPMMRGSQYEAGREAVQKEADETGEEKTKRQRRGGAGSDIETKTNRGMLSHTAFFILILTAGMCSVVYYFGYGSMFNSLALTLPAAAIVQFVSILSAAKSLGGMNGDISGASIVIAETTAAVVFALSL